jgi:hypothetical protein
MNELDWKQPALVGGLIVGVLSAIPGISFLNCCFCAWALIGGAVAARMLIGRTPRPVQSGEGAQVGLMAGVIAAVAFIVVSIPIVLSGFAVDFFLNIMESTVANTGDPRLIEAMQQAREQAATQSAAQRLVSSIPWLLGQAIVLGGFTVLGGLLGVALFEKRKDQPPPSQYPPNYPPNYPPPSGGYGGGSYGGDQGGWPPSNT